jgi:pyruvate dehydrogenase E1 component alpha subunit
MQISHDKLRWAYERMLLIRYFEDQVHQLFLGGKLPGFAHLYAGEEAVAVGVCAHLSAKDFITSTHRAHGHGIAKGSDPGALMAELYGKATGVCKGKGGSMHVADLSVGFFGANPIVGAGSPQACGLALAAKVKRTGSVAVCFFGDGAFNQGSCHEALNEAAIWKLPVVFVCENNLYAQSTPIEYGAKAKNVADRASAYGMPGVTVDGMDFFAVYEAAKEALDRARTGEGPTLLEAKTYRFYGHFEGDAMKYRSKEEEQVHHARDPLANFRKKVLSDGLMTTAELKQIEEQVQAKIQAALRFAEESPYPDPKECLTDVYVNYP